MIGEYKVGSRTDVGCVRTHNEDSLLVMTPLFAVADGMGGHEAGEIASEIATRTLAEYAPLTLDEEALVGAVGRANTAIVEAVERGIGRPGMGCTLTAVVLEADRMLVAQVGDSRLYLLHGGTLQQVTRDHSLVEELVAAGEITEAEAAVHPNRSIITRALGGEEESAPDIYNIKINPGTRLLLCSDGLSGMIDDKRIRTILSGYKDPQEAADALVEAARKAGGYDNISAIVVDSFDISRNTARKKRRRSGMGAVIFFLLFVLLVGGTVGGTYLYATKAVFLKAQDGYVAVYRGISEDLLPGVNLQWQEYVSDVPVDQLPPTLVERLQTGIQVDTLDEAALLISEYRYQIVSQASGV
jgi:protein phosphatase